MLDGSYVTTLGCIEVLFKLLGNKLKMLWSVNCMQAILTALQHAWSSEHMNVIVESDCQKAIEILNNMKSLQENIFFTRAIYVVNSS